MNKPFVKFITYFGPLLIFFTVYFKNGNDLKLALPPFIVATLISLIVIYFLERKIPIIPLSSGILITFFGGLTLYFDNPVFYYVKPTIINLLFAGIWPRSPLSGLRPASAGLLLDYVARNTLVRRNALWP